MTRGLTKGENGFGLVEIVVSILILGLLAISFLPLLVQGVRIAANNRILATATQIVYDELEQARASELCTELTDLAGNETRGDYKISRTAEHPSDSLADPCSISIPGVVKYTVVVENLSDERLVDATTLILVTG